MKKALRQFGTPIGFLGLVLPSPENLKQHRQDKSCQKYDREEHGRNSLH